MSLIEDFEGRTMDSALAGHVPGAASPVSVAMLVGGHPEPE
jgi:hypothetical protein